ncbi:GTPase [Streptomyces sp. NBRC 110035]|uniref:GTPase n=1 Tax=Streptomyces sp. NBRC 110035 TaxID=1547867 RepID=UPI0005A62A65|nr:GTPase [Streptomyces sp. NBRC 110035]
MDESRLAAAAARAVAESAPLARELAAGLREVERTVGRPTDLSDGAALTEEQRALYTEERRLRRRAVELVGELAGGRLRALDTFNVVLFGRTGAGKSSLVEALTGGDGARISPGRPDHTTEVEEVRWAGLRLFDTPGTNGWGRDGDNRHLEEAARQAVLVADVVLLCFDDDSQLEGEFTKVAQWVLAYGKPAVVVLNCKVPVWRDTDAIAERDVRVFLSTTVAQHAAHIREWLAALGLPQVPVVALSAQRAVAARAADPYRGKDGNSIRNMRRAGRTTLLRRSNLPVLESLLTEAVGSGAAQLRYGGLLTQTAGALSGIADELDRVLTAPALEGARTIETGLEELLEELGLPEDLLPPGTDTADGPGTVPGGGDGVPADVPGRHEDADADLARVLRELRELQKLRGGPFPAPARGRARVHLDHLLTSGFGKLRLTLEARAEKLVDTAFRERKPLSAEDFNAAVFKSDELTAVIDKSLASFTSDVESRLGLVVADLRAGLARVDARVDGLGREVRGDAGSGYRTFGCLAGYTSAGASLLSVGASAASLLFLTTPVGWIAAAGLAVVAGGGRLAARFGLRRGQQRRYEARGEYLEQAREAVYQETEAVRERVAAHCVALVRQAVLVEVGPLVRQAVALRRIAGAASRDRALLNRTVEELPQGRDAADILAEAVGRAEAAAGVTHPAGADRLWLGSDWCDDPHNLLAGGGAAEGRRNGRSPGLAPNVLDRLRTVFRRGPHGPAPGAGRQWLAELHRWFDDDPHAAGLLAELDALAADPRPRIAVTGNLSTGKSAFVHRLLVESGLPVPESLTSAAGPETWRVVPYEWGDLVLVDTPGFQSGREGHSEAARTALADAAAVIHLFSPLMLVGERADLLLLLRGAPEAGRFSKQGRTLWVINKIDRLAVAGDARDLRAHVGRAKKELAAALERIAPGGRASHREHIVSMAAAPYGLRAAHSRHYDDFRAWDGFGDFAASVRELRLTLEPNAGDVTLLHGGAARLGVLRAGALEQAEDIERRIVEVGRLADEAVAGARTGRGVVASMTKGAERLAVAFTTRLVHETLEEGVDAPVREARGRRLESWTTDKEFAGGWQRHRAGCERAAQAWLTSVANAVERRAASPAYATAFPDDGNRVDLSFLSAESLRVWSGDLLVNASVGLAPAGELRADDLVALAAQYDVALDAGELDGLLGGVHDVGVILKIINAVSMISALMTQSKREEELEEFRVRLTETMRRSAEAWAQSVRGGCGAVEEVCGRLEALAVQLTRKQGELLEELTRTRRRAQRCTAAIEGARLRLGEPAGAGAPTGDGRKGGRR